MTALSQPYRLPPEPYWEAAARGPLVPPSPEGGAVYPWGPTWDPACANTLEGRLMRPSPVGAYVAAGGVGPNGAEDQSGNVYEWTASLYLPYPYNPAAAEQPEAEGERTLRGGAWGSDRRLARSAYRFRYVPGDFNYTLGFRLFSPG